MVFPPAVEPVPSSRRLACMSFGTIGVNKKLQAGIMRNSALQIPQRLDIAMIDSGKWCLRNDVIWHKRNGQPNTSQNRFGLGDYEHEGPWASYNILPK